MKRIFLFCLVAHAVGAFADEPAWPSDFWDQVAAGRATAAASGEVRVTSGEALPAFDTWSVVRVRSNGINFRSDRSGATLIIR